MSIYFNIYQTACCDYYDDEWRSEIFTCPRCGWEGRCDDMDGPNGYAELMDYGCPECEKMLLIIDYPTIHETIRAAARGNEFARRQLNMMGEVKKILKARAHEEKPDKREYLPG